MGVRGFGLAKAQTLMQTPWAQGATSDQKITAHRAQNEAFFLKDAAAMKLCEGAREVSHPA